MGNGMADGHTCCCCLCCPVHVLCALCTVRCVRAMCLAPCIVYMCVVGVTCTLEDNDARNVVGTPETDFQQSVMAVCEAGFVTPEQDLSYRTTCTSSGEFDPKIHCIERDYDHLFQKLYDADYDVLISNSYITSLGTLTGLTLDACKAQALQREADMFIYSGPQCILLLLGEPAELSIAVTKYAGDSAFDVYTRGDLNVAHIKPVTVGAAPAQHLVDGNFDGGACQQIADSWVTVDLGYWYRVVRVAMTVNQVFPAAGVVSIYVVNDPEFQQGTVPDSSSDKVLYCGGVQYPAPHPQMTYITTCVQARQGRFVSVLIYAGTMSMCELAVYTQQENLNVALGKTFTTTPPYLSDKTSVRLVDGIRYGNSLLRSCFEAPANVDEMPQLLLDLGTSHRIFKVVIVTGASSTQQTNFSVWVTDNLEEMFECVQGREVGVSQVGVIYCVTPLTGHYVHLQGNAANTPLSLCELEVYSFTSSSTLAAVINGTFVWMGHDVRRAGCPLRSGYGNTYSGQVTGQECATKCLQTEACAGFTYGANLDPPCINMEDPTDCVNWAPEDDQYVGWKIGWCEAVTYENAVQVNTAYYGDVTQGTCSTGYSRVPTDRTQSSFTMTCTINGWIREPNDTCTAVTCTLTTAPQSSSVTTLPVTVKYLQTVLVNCSEGYVFRPTTGINWNAAYPSTYVLTCAANHFLQAAYQCERIPCSVATPANTNYTAVTVTGFFGATVIMQCVTGHRVQGEDNGVTSNVMTCQPNGTWDSVRNCEPKVCDRPWPANTVNTSANLMGAFPTNITVMCEYGYVIPSNNVSYMTTCNATGDWDVYLNCTPIMCSTPWPANTEINDDPSPEAPAPYNAFYPDEANVSCIYGYVIVGTSRDRKYVMACQGDGTFNMTAGCTPIRCDRLTNAHVQEDMAMGQYQDTITLHCDPGYRTYDSNVLTSYNTTCRASGSWTLIRGCKPVQCPDVQPAGTRDNLTGVYPEEVRVRCSHGYITTLYGPDFITDDNYTSPEVIREFNSTCQENGTWSYVISCRRTFCKSAPFGNTTASLPPALPISGQYEDTVHSSCLSGYWTKLEHQDEYDANCTAWGVWEIKDCVSVECPALTIAHSDVTEIYGVYEQKEKVTCKDNYETLYGLTDYFSVCESFGNWSRWDACILRECEGLTLQHSNITNHSLAAGDSAVAQCDQGYEISGDTIFTYTCSRTREWLSTQDCTKVKCGPLLVANCAPGFWNLYGVFGDEHDFQCEPGHEDAQGQSGVHITCTADGKWEPTPACDPVVCSAPIPVGTSLYPGTMAKAYDGLQFVTCQTGYVVTGTTDELSYTAFCEPTATFSRLDTCSVVQCGAEDPTPFGWEQGLEASPYLTEAQVSCRAGHQANGTTNLTLVCGSRGDWNLSTAVCFAVKCLGLAAFNVDQAGESGQYGDAPLSIRCLDGHVTPSGQTAYSATCLANGTWSKEESCWRLNCSAITLPNTTAVDVEAVAGETVKAHCLFGHAILSTKRNFTLFCNLTGHWEGSANCSLVQCEPFIVSHAVLPVGSRVTGEYGDTVDVVCGQGYTMIDGSQSVVTACSADGTWNWTGDCEPINCTEPVYPRSLVLAGALNRTLGSVNQFTCATGYVGPTGTGVDGVRCLHNGSWTELPSCIPICPPAIPIAHGYFNVTEVGVTLVAQYTCDEGYQLQGDYSYIVCQHTEEEGTTWTAPPPTCLRAPIDGEWTVWMAWTKCTATCGEGRHTRVRHCEPPRYGGQDCEGAFTEENTCSAVPCPVNAQVHPWTEWTACSTTCGDLGLRERNRTCTPSKHGGRTCADQGYTSSGIQQDFVKCELPACPEPVFHRVRMLELEPEEVDDPVPKVFVALAFGIFVGMGIFVDVVNVLMARDAQLLRANRQEDFHTIGQ